MDARELLKHLMGQCGEHDYSGWVRVGKLKPEDITRRKKHEADAERCQAELNVLVSKIHALKAQSNSDSEEWWEHLHQTYSLPRKRSYIIGEENFILMEPKEKA